MQWPLLTSSPTFFAAAACCVGCIDGWRGCLSCCKPPTRRLKHRECSAISFRRNSCLHPPSRHLHLTNMTIFDKFHVAVFTKPAHVSISGRMISHFELYFDLVLVLSPFARRIITELLCRVAAAAAHAPLHSPRACLKCRRTSPHALYAGRMLFASRKSHELRLWRNLEGFRCPDRRCRSHHRESSRHLRHSTQLLRRRHFFRRTVEQLVRGARRA